MFLQTEDRRKYKELRDRLREIEESYVESVTEEKTAMARELIEDMNRLYGKTTKTASGPVAAAAKAAGLEAVCFCSGGGGQGRTTWNLFHRRSGRRVGSLGMNGLEAEAVARTFALGYQIAVAEMAALAASTTKNSGRT